MADVTRQIRSEAFLDLTGIQDDLTAFWRVRYPLAVEARRRKLAESSDEELAKYYKMLVDLRDQERGILDRSLTAGMSANRDLSGESRARMGLQGDYVSAAAQRDVEAMKQTGMNDRQKRDQAYEMVVTRLVPQQELDEIAARSAMARQLWTTTTGDFNTKLANLTEAARADTAELVKGKTGMHAEAIALQIVRDLGLIVNPSTGEEKAAFDAAMLSIYGTYGITPILDKDTGEMVPPAVKKATDVEVNTAISEQGATTVYRGPANAPASSPGSDAQTFSESPAPQRATTVRATPAQAQAASAGTVLTDPEWTTGLPEDAVPVRAPDGQVYARLWDGSYIVHPKTLFAGNIGVVEDFKAGNAPLREAIEDKIKRLEAKQAEAEESGDADQIALDFFPKAASTITAGASKYGAWYAKLSPSQRRAEDIRRSEFLKSIAPTPRLSAATKAADETIAASREAVEGDFAAAPTKTESVLASLADKKDVIALLKEKYHDTESDIKSAGLDKDSTAAKEARGAWFNAYMEATKDIPPEAQEAFADRLGLPPEARAAVGTIIKGRLAPDAATREADADEALRTKETEEAVDADIQRALKGEEGPTARTQGERDFEALAKGGAEVVARNYIQLAKEAEQVGGTLAEHLSGFEGAANRRAAENAKKAATMGGDVSANIEAMGGDYAKAVEYALPKPAVKTPDKRVYAELAPEGGRVVLDSVAKAWDARERPFVGQPGKALPEDALMDEGEKDDLRAEYDTLRADDLPGDDADPDTRAAFGEEREAYVEIMLEQRRKKKEATNAAKP